MHVGTLALLLVVAAICATSALLILRSRRHRGADGAPTHAAAPSSASDLPAASDSDHRA